MISQWLQPRVYFLSSLCSPCQYYVTQTFTPSPRNSASRVHTQRFSSYFFGRSSWALLVSLLLLDSEPQGSALGLFPCLSASTPGMISTGLVVIATASKLVFLPPYWSPYSDTAAKASLLKYESDRVILWLTPLQRLSSTSEERLRSLQWLTRPYTLSFSSLSLPCHLSTWLWPDLLLLFLCSLMPPTETPPVSASRPLYVLIS